MLGTALVVGAGTLGIALRSSLASDHQDTPEVELHPRLDINDVYAFPGSNANRIALVLTTSSPLTPAASAGAVFDPDILYQIKVDNTGDGVEDLVLQFTFDGDGAGQQVTMRGPVAPVQTGRVNTIVASRNDGLRRRSTRRSGPEPACSSSPGFATIRSTSTSSSSSRSSPIAHLCRDRCRRSDRSPEASAFRNPGIDFLRNINALGIVVEMPESMLLAPNSGADPKLGIWATTSR